VFLHLVGRGLGDEFFALADSEAHLTGSPLRV
jgi:hypothetical protein